MQKEYNKYLSSFSGRCAPAGIWYLFSPKKRFRTWRKLWTALAETERELGLPITEEQITESKAHAEGINYKVAEAREREMHHDVVSHIYAYGKQCPSAKGIIHLGATSCYMGDNTDIILMTGRLRIVRRELLNVVAELASFAEKYRDLPTLAFTHLQPMQSTTVGKRATLWINELLLDLEDLDHVLANMKLLSYKGTMGTRASFGELSEGDGERIKKIDPMITGKMGFLACVPASDQTYSRKIDTRVLNVFADTAQSARKFSNDVRLLQHLKEVEEPFEKGQIGSSAMAYKRSPIRCERTTSLADYMMSDVIDLILVASTQWFERTLDDSANKRLSIPEGFLAISDILHLYMNAMDGLVVYPRVIGKRLMAELPFMATGNIMVDAVKAGDDRQELRGKIRELSMIAGQHVKAGGRNNDLLTLIIAKPSLHLNLADLGRAIQPEHYIDRSAEQITDYLSKVVNPLLKENQDMLGKRIEIQV